MGCSVRELLSRIDSRELSEWQAFENVEPFGDAWRQTGLLAALLHNAHFEGVKKTVEDFMPIPRAEAPNRDFLYFQIFAAQHNAVLATQ